MFEICIHHRIDGNINVTRRVEPNPTLAYILGPFEDIRKAPIMSVKTFVLKDNQRVTLTFPGAQDANGNPVPYAGPLSVVASDPSALLVTPGNDANSFVIAAAQEAGHLGDFQLTLSDTDLTETVIVSVVAGAEVSLGVAFGIPEDIPVPTSTGIGSPVDTGTPPNDGSAPAPADTITS